jgi:hypothetical protein
MDRSRGIFAVLALLFVTGVGSLVRFSDNLFHASENVRSVDIFGLSGGGAACGAAIFGVIFILVSGRRRPTEDKNPSDKQPPPHWEKPSEANHRLKLPGAAILVFRDPTALRAAPAA